MALLARTLVAIVCAAAAVVLPACGSDAGSSAPEFSQKLRAVCADAARRLDEAAAGGSVEAAVVVADLVDDLRALEPPAGKRRPLDAAVAAGARARDTLRAAPRRGEGAAPVGGRSDPLAEVRTRMEALGVPGCLGDAGAGGAPAVVRVEAREYRFSAPAAVGAGPAVIELVNAGSEEHEMGVVRLRPGVRVQAVIDAEARGEDAGALVENAEVAVVGPARPGESARAAAPLAPGVYAFACFLDAPDGQSHVAKGMYGEFVVKG